MRKNSEHWTDDAKAHFLDNIQDYLQETQSGRVTAGIRIILPEILRHFYIFHRVAGFPDVEAMVMKGRFLFYQLPYSEASYSSNWIKRIDEKVAYFTNERTPDNWSYPLAGINYSLDAINNSLSSSVFDIQFVDTRATHELLSCGPPGTVAFHEFQENYQCERIVPFIRQNRAPQDYKESLFELEKVLYENAIDARIAVRQYPMFHLGTWFGILIIMLDKCQVKSLLQFDSQVATVLPWIAQKMYRFVVEKRFAARLFECNDAWTVDHLSRIAATGGMNMSKVVSDSKTIEFSETGSPSCATEYDCVVPFKGEQWKVRFKTSRRNDAYIEHALSEMQEMARVAHERITQSRRSATAAIMSRNMSHNLGSHALANSKFFGSVGLLDKGEEGKPEDMLDATKADAQGARSRLQSFNQYCQGRLDFIARKLSEEGDSAEPMFLVKDVLNGFMTQQVLLDTLLDDNGFNTENIGFVIHGNGKMDIWKYAQTGTGKERKHWEFDPPAKQEVEDVLVGVTGGVTGCHALYALFENLLRNAAKYSRRDQIKDKTLELHIKFDQLKVNGEECYRLRLWENLTNDNNLRTAAIVRDGLSKDVINEVTGKPIKGGHGMQEMRLCAEYLAGTATLRFPSDKPLACDKNGEDGKDDQDYIMFLDRSKKSIVEGGNGVNHKDLSAPALRAYIHPLPPEPKESADKPEAAEASSIKSALVYELLLPNPILLGLVCVRQYGDGMRFSSACRPQDPCIKAFAGLEQMAAKSPHFGLIIAHDAEQATIKDTLVGVARLYQALPFRLLVVTPTEEDGATWRREILNASANLKRLYPADEDGFAAAIEAFNPGSESLVAILPNRRLHVICNESFFSNSRTGQPHTCNAVENDICMRLQSISRGAWKDIVLNVYEQWIIEWKGRPKGDGLWNLMIGFQRDAEQVRQRWLEPLQSCMCAKSLLDVTIGSTQNGTISFFTRDIAPQPHQSHVEPSSCLVFDNHGEVFSKIKRNELRFYHKFSGGELTLFQLLETPPTEPFAFGFYLLGLLEGCLTNIVTLDERVADAALIGGEPAVGRNNPLGLLRLSGIHPLFSFDRNPNDLGDNASVVDWMALVGRRFITPNINGSIKKKLEDIDGISVKVKEQIRHEGIRFAPNAGINPFCEISDNNHSGHQIIGGVLGGATPRHLLIDAIIIHEGIIDSLLKDKEGLWQEGDHLRLYSLLPFVVRTSGRGRESRHLGQVLPFIELNVISDSCYGSLNKIKLARALLGASGELEGPEKKDE